MVSAGTGLDTIAMIRMRLIAGMTEILCIDVPVSAS